MYKFLFAIAIITTSIKAWSKSIQNLHIAKITCENEIRPINIGTRTPRFGWVLESPVKNIKQTAYEINVTTLPADDHVRSFVWKSGKVYSDQSIWIPYAGARLRSDKRYNYEVTVWDNSGHKASVTSYFETTLYEQSDWQAKWITSPAIFNFDEYENRIHQNTKDQPQPTENLALFRKSWKITKKIKSAKVYVSGLGFYELYINGRKVGDQVLAPGVTDYSKRVLFNAFDLSDDLISGMNTVGVMLGNGWYNQVCNDVWGFSKADWRGRPKFILQLNIQYADGSRTMIVSDDKWLTIPGPVTVSGLWWGESYDARKEIKNWNNTDCDTVKWQSATYTLGPTGRLQSQVRPQVKIRKILKINKQWRKGNSDTIVVDFGTELAGFIQLNGKQPSGTTVRFSANESLTKDSLVDMQRNSELIGDSRFQTDEYTYSDNEKVSWHPHFSYGGFRYVQITGWKGELNDHDIEACVISADITSRSYFKCSEKLINDIQSAITGSARDNFIHYPTDCPQREKLGWTGDAQIMSSTIHRNFTPHNAYADWFRDIILTQLPDGRLSVIAPTSGWGYHSTWTNYGLTTDWNYILFELPWQQYLQTGDNAMIKESYVPAKRYIDNMSSYLKNGILEQGLGDWIPAKTRTPVAITSTAIFYDMLNKLVFTGEMLGKDKEMSRYKSLALKVKNSFCKNFFDDKGNFKNPTETGLGAAIYFKMLNGEQLKQLASQLSDSVKNSKLNIDFGILGSKFVPVALAKNGFNNTVYNFVNSVEYPGWGNMISRGATTLWESWNGDHSLNHPMFGSISEWLFNDLGGIKPDPSSPGYKHFFIEPYIPLTMHSVDCAQECMYGLIKVFWQKKDKDLIVDLTVPVNTTARFTFPDNYYVVKETPLTGDKFERHRDLGSGRHIFQLKATH